MSSPKIFTRCKTPPWPGKGEWVGVIIEGKSTARAGCPGCGAISTMSDHEIGDKGAVTPSVGCPNDCGYHEVGVILKDWPFIL